MCDARLWHDVRSRVEWVSVDAPIIDFETVQALAVAALKSVDGPIIPVGFSMGAIVALMMAKLAPARIAGLVLASTNCTADLPERSAARLLQQDAVRQGHLGSVIRDELKPQYLSPSTLGDARENILDLTYAMAMDLGPEVFVRQSEALRTRPGLCDVLDTCTKPILIIAGSDDTLCPPAWHQVMADRATRSTFVSIPKAGHLVPLESPIPFNHTLTTWLSAHQPEFLL
jgi:pimeloyl-ACP methyl ester carboxylesterase